MSGYGKILKRIQTQKRNKCMSQTEQPKSKIPQCLSSINDLVSKVDKLKSGLFKDSPDYFKTSLNGVRETLMEMFKNLTVRMTEIPKISNEKITAIANSVGIDSETKKDLLAIVAASQGNILTPELIKDNLDTFKVIYDESNVEANENEIVFNADAEFTILIDGKEKDCTLKGKFPVPLASLILSSKEA
jgi:hypothetical protein